MHRNQESSPDARDLLSRVKALLAAQPGHALPLRELREALDIGADDRKAFRAVLAAAVESGELLTAPGRRFLLPDSSPVVEGIVHRHERGFGWLLGTNLDGANDPFIPPGELEGLLHGDRVRARIERGRGGRSRAVILAVLSQTPRTLGTARRKGERIYVDVDGLPDPLFIHQPPPVEVQDGMAVEVEIDERSTPHRMGQARVLRVVGWAGDLNVEVEKIISNARVPQVFDEKVTQQAASANSDIEAEAKKESIRRDITDIPLVTIDGETAKDFDDAVHVEPQEGGYLLTVAIADVSHYVTEDSLLDLEAARRGTSIYMPGRVIPMLPHRLSDGLCSLRPHEPRLCMVAQMTFPKGKAVPTHVELFPGLMRSRARLTYNRVQEGIDQELHSLPEAEGFDLASAVALYRKLRKARLGRGALDIDLPEQEVALDEAGEPTLMRAAPRLEAHMLIEEFMIAANEAVARWFEERELPTVYRIHEPPDPEKLERFRALARVHHPTLKLKSDPTPKDLSAFLQALKSQPDVQALQTMLLRSLMQARYSTDNVGHYGLASESYLHFTSPIRRYPDLLVHRELRRALHAGFGKKKPRKRADEEAPIHPREKALAKLADQSSQCERTSTEIERQVDALYATRFCQQHLDQVFPGVITAVAEFGLFVLMTPLHAEGLLPIQSLGNDFFERDELGTRLTGQRTKRSFQLGQAVQVRIVDANLSRRQVTLALDQPAEAQDGAERRRWRAKDPFEQGESKPKGWPPSGRKPNGGKKKGPQRRGRR